MEKPPKIVAVSEKIYRRLLRLYPQSHRREYAELMTQLFRDQCRDAWRTGRSAGLMKHWLRVLPDIGRTSVMEQIAAFERNQIMKYINAKNGPAFLLIAGLLLGLFSFSFAHSAEILRLMVSASALVILTKAAFELFRPSSEWVRISLGTLALMFVYAMFMPAWAKLDPNVPDTFKIAVMACLFANPFVTAVKLLQFLVQRRKS